MLFVAKDAGIFQKHGLDAQVVNVRSGAVGLSALAAGETQFHGGSATGASIGAMAGGLDLVFVAGLINKLDGTFVVAPNIRLRRISRAKESACKVSAAACGCSACWLSITGDSIPSETTFSFGSSAIRQ